MAETGRKRGCQRCCLCALLSMTEIVAYSCCQRYCLCSWLPMIIAKLALDQLPVTNCLAFARAPQQSPIEPVLVRSGSAVAIAIRKEKWFFFITSATAEPDRTSIGPVGLCCGVRKKESGFSLWRMPQQSAIEPVLVRLGCAVAFAIRKSGFPYGECHNRA